MAWTADNTAVAISGGIYPWQEIREGVENRYNTSIEATRAEANARRRESSAAERERPAEKRRGRPRLRLTGHARTHQGAEPRSAIFARPRRPDSSSISRSLQSRGGALSRDLVRHEHPRRTQKPSSRMARLARSISRLRSAPMAATAADSRDSSSLRPQFSRAPHWQERLTGSNHALWRRRRSRREASHRWRD